MNKKYERAVKNLGPESVKELEELSVDGLKQVVVAAEQIMKEASDELEANPKYQELKENIKAIQASKKEINVKQKSKIVVALELLATKGA